MNIISLRKKFVHGLRWNSIESIFYYTCLAMHQIMLCRVLSTTLYGAMGTLFSLVYLVIALFNFGFDLSIGPFFSLYKSSKLHFKKYLIRQLMGQGVIYGLVAIVLSIILRTHVLPIRLMPIISWPLAVIIGLLVVSEGVKKSLRIVLQYAFLSHLTAAIEILYIISYMMIVWGIYLARHHISLITLFFPMFFLSLISTILLLAAVYKLYRHMPSVAAESCSTWKTIGYNRMFNYGYQVSRELFTSNFLIPFFAIKFGLSLAALLELVKPLNQFITIIIKKVFGITGQTILAHTKRMDMASKRVAFKAASTPLYRVLFFVVGALLIAFKPLVALKSSSIDEKIGILFFVFLFSENFILLYEKWFIIEEKTHYLIVFNSCLVLILWALLQLPRISSAYIMLCILIMLRFAAYAGLMVMSYIKWKLPLLR